jgi:ankyrin repeat protein
MNLDLIYAACQEGDLETLHRLFPHDPTQWRSPQEHSLLHWTLQTPHLPVLNWLLTFSVDVNAPTMNKYTPLMWTCIYQHEGMARRLLDQGAHVQTAGFLGQTALHFACSRKWVDGVILLLQHGADPEVRDARGKLPNELVGTHPDHAVIDDLLNAAQHGCGLK